MLVLELLVTTLVALCIMYYVYQLINMDYVWKRSKMIFKS